MTAAVSKLMRVQDLIAAASKDSCRYALSHHGRTGRKRLSARLQPNHPTDDLAGIAASMLDGLLLGSGDAVIGINPAGDNVVTTTQILRLIDALRNRFQIPVQSCVLAHITTQTDGARTRRSGGSAFSIHRRDGGGQPQFWRNLALLDEAQQAGQSLRRGATCADGSTGNERHVL